MIATKQEAQAWLSDYGIALKMKLVTSATHPPLGGNHAGHLGEFAVIAIAQAFEVIATEPVDEPITPCPEPLLESGKRSLAWGLAIARESLLTCRRGLLEIDEGDEAREIWAACERVAAVIQRVRA